MNKKIIRLTYIALLSISNTQNSKAYFECDLRGKCTRIENQRIENAFGESRNSRFWMTEQTTEKIFTEVDKTDSCDDFNPPAKPIPYTPGVYPPLAQPSISSEVPANSGVPGNSEVPGNSGVPGNSEVPGNSGVPNTTPQKNEKTCEEKFQDLQKRKSDLLCKIDEIIRLIENKIIPQLIHLNNLQKDVLNKMTLVRVCVGIGYIPEQEPDKSHPIKTYLEEIQKRFTKLKSLRARISNYNIRCNNCNSPDAEKLIIQDTKKIQEFEMELNYSIELINNAVDKIDFQINSQNGFKARINAIMEINSLNPAVIKTQCQNIYPLNDQETIFEAQKRIIVSKALDVFINGTPTKKGFNALFPLIKQSAQGLGNTTCPNNKNSKKLSKVFACAPDVNV